MKHKCDIFDKDLLNEPCPLCAQRDRDILKARQEGYLSGLKKASEIVTRCLENYKNEKTNNSYPDWAKTGIRIAVEALADEIKKGRGA